VSRKFSFVKKMLETGGDSEIFFQCLPVIVNRTGSESSKVLLWWTL